jgi:GntR family transcriptional regulator, galactonate operon transcriptional repressor
MSLHREMMAVLLGAVTAGVMEEGEKLPTLTELASRFGVSTGVARECQRALAERGIVSVHHGRRAVVRPEADWDVFHPEVLEALLAGPRGSQVLGEYLESRRIVEVEAAALAAERATPEAVRDVARAFERMQTAAEEASVNRAAETHYRETDVAFHRAIIRATGNRTLARMAEPIHRALNTTFGALARPEARFERSLPEHRRILEAIERNDPGGAREAMRAHLLTVEGYLQERVASDNGRAS